MCWLVGGLLCAVLVRWCVPHVKYSVGLNLSCILSFDLIIYVFKHQFMQVYVRSRYRVPNLLRRAVWPGLSDSRAKQQAVFACAVQLAASRRGGRDASGE